MIHQTNYFLFLLVVIIASSCTITLKAPKDRLYLSKNTFEVKGGNFNKIEQQALEERMANQLDDSAKILSKSFLFFFEIVRSPPVFDTGYAGISARNMQASMYHLGYYGAKTTYTADTLAPKVKVHYTTDLGKLTRIDTVVYIIDRQGINAKINESLDQGLIKKNDPVTKLAIVSELNRITDTLRNNGYYKFTPGELRVRGDTTIEALTRIGADPLEDFLLLQQAQAQRDSPIIKLAVVLNPPSDTSRLNAYHIRRIYILPDFGISDNLLDTTTITQRSTRSFILRYHQELIRTGFFIRNIPLRPGDLFRQNEFNRSISNLSRAGIWSSVDARILEVPDSNLVDIVYQLAPGKKFGFEAALEASYSAVSSTTNALGGNLFGLSTNFSLVNRNIGREAIRMTHTLRAGVELNNKQRTNNSSLINSTELSYRNNILFPRLITPIRSLSNIRQVGSETYINTGVSYINRFDLFSIQNASISYGWNFKGKRERVWNIRPFYAEFSYLYNQTDSFKNILVENPFLKYAFNTAFVMGMGGGYSSIYRNPKHMLSESKERSLKLNVEESGLTYGSLPVLEKYKKRYIRSDAEYKYTVKYAKNVLVIRLYTGIGLPITRKDTTLPFFKQYFGGGSNSMRGWPVRGIGLGSQPLSSRTRNQFNSRTGDMQIEGNIEYRYDIARIIPNTLTLRGAVFADAGNIWNIKNTKPDGSKDSAQFKFKNLYREMGLSAGTGFRLDFNYFILRFDLGFRFKRPETSYTNDGWHLPNLGNNSLRKLFSTRDEFRQWRYENFNFTIGISYPF